MCQCAELPLGTLRGLGLVSAGRMRAVFKNLFSLLLISLSTMAWAQQQEWIIEARDQGGSVTFDLSSGFKNALTTYSNGVVVRYGAAWLEADTATVDQNSGAVQATGRVRVQNEDMVWVGEDVAYNFKTRQMQSSSFRAGRAPVYISGGVSGEMLGDSTNHTYTATNAVLTLDDFEKPFFQVRAKKLVIQPGRKFTAHGATLYAGGVPVFFVPVYTQRLDGDGPALLVTPGYDSRFGGFLLGSYGWQWGKAVDGRLHVDYRTKRGFGVGPDMDFQLGQWGDALLRYYYLNDTDPELASNLQPFPSDRQRVEFKWFASPYTNTTFKSQVSYASDEGLRREFFEGEYRRNIQPNTYLEARHFWDNFSLSALAQPRVNDFFNSTERLPEVKLNGFRQQLGATPLFYESESSVGYYRRRFSETNGSTGLDFEAGRADTFHQIILPHTFFGWLNVTPRVGGRLSYYGESEGPGAAWQQEDRAVFNTGAEASMKASRLWAGSRSQLLELDGVRHIVEPSVNYVYVPTPSTKPNQLPPFDYELPSLQLLPVDFPDYNAIDNIDAQNVLRLGLRNRLQTKRDGQLDEFLFWNVFADWRLNPDPGQDAWSDVWSDFKFKPRSWMTLESVNRLDVEDGQMELSFNAITLQPARSWSWRGAYFYLRDDFSPNATAWGLGQESVVSTFYFRLNENWGLRLSHYFDIVTSELREQSYGVYRDFRSWTGALALRFRENEFGSTEWSVSFNLSLKALPRYSVGEDTVTRGVLMSD